MDWQVQIESDPASCGDRPRVRETRLTVAFLLRLKMAGWRDAMILNIYPNSAQDNLRAVFAFAQSLIAGKTFFPEPRVA